MGIEWYLGETEAYELGKGRPGIKARLQKAREKMSDKIEYTLDFDAATRSGRIEGPAELTKNAATLPVPKLKTGRYRVTFERVRAELPPEHYWDGTEIVRREGKCCKARYCVTSYGVVGRTTSDMPAAVHTGVIDAFRAEGLLPKAGT